MQRSRWEYHNRMTLHRGRGEINHVKRLVLHHEQNILSLENKPGSRKVRTANASTAKANLLSRQMRN